MDLFQLEESCWATLKANEMHVKSVFSVESIKITGSWYVMQWCLTHRYQLWSSLAFPSSGLKLKNSCTLMRGGGAAGFSKLFGSFYQTSWSHIPWLYTQQTEVPIIYYMPNFNIQEHQGLWTVRQIPQKICVKFFTSQNTWWCSPSEPVQYWEFISVVCSGVTLTGGYGYK